ncbi:MAG: DUF11 domain-containing protein, partial [Chloroflexi bacterium]|nr:DUF11 domain-containing protein [Chloroflexota bacterium]
MWAGDPLTYTIIVDNLGPGDAQGVILQELMRSSGEFNLVSVSSDRDIDSTAWSGTFSGDFEFEITLEDPLEVGGRWLVEIVVEADETQDINNCVTVVSDYLDPNTADNNSCADHAITDRADLAIYKYAEGFIPTGCEDDLRAWAPGEYMPRGNDDGGYWFENEVAAGSWLWYGLWVENEGPSTAENVVAVDYLPLGLIYRGAWYYVEDDDDWYEADCTVNQTLDRVTCNLDSLAPGEGVEIWIALDVPSWMPEGTELWNTARVYSDIYDHNNANDTANNLTTVHAVADIAVTKESVPETALPWQEISYVITVENLGPSDAPGTLVHDEVPPQVSGVIWSAEFFGGATGNPSGNWAIHEMVNLPAGSKVVYTVHGMLDTYWPVTNTVEVMTAENVWDPCDENNSATDVNAPKLNFLPILFKQASRIVDLPNLVVERIVATETGIQVDVRNIGDAPVYQGFWVDLYVNPPVEPTRVNQIWNDPEGDGTYCNFPVCQGLAWGVTGNSLPLNPGDLLILRVDDSYPKINWP